MLTAQLEEELRPNKCYAVADLQERLGISMLEIIEAVESGEIPRSLGERFEMHVMGIDVVDWLAGRPQVWSGRYRAAGNGNCHNGSHQRPQDFDAEADPTDDPFEL